MSDRAAGEARVLLKHGGGGRAMRALVSSVFVEAFAGPGTNGAEGVGLAALDDGAALPMGDRWLVFTTDSHVVKPLFFPGGDIGRLAIAGTVNDLAMMGGTEVLGLSFAVVVEEGFPRADLERVVASARDTCAEAGVEVLTGDTKVMGRGEVDGLVINTAGIAMADALVRDDGLEPGDRIIVTGSIGDHGFAVLSARNDLGLEGELRSDVAPIGSLVERALGAAPVGSVVALKDPTRGGLASALAEMGAKSGVAIHLDQAAIPLSDGVRAASELLGIDPLHVANEGKAVLGVRPAHAEAVLEALRQDPRGTRAAIVGVAAEGRPGAIELDTGFGRRLLPELDGEPLPRIC